MEDATGAFAGPAYARMYHATVDIPNSMTRMYYATLTRENASG
jgi:hypothetical protein